jgi:hypothetical protein
MPRTAAPARVETRPDPSQWRDDELMTLGEAAALFWPAGPLSMASLRTAHRNGQLAVAVIARKFLTTKAAVEAMARENLHVTPSRPAVRERCPERALAPPREDALRRKIAECIAIRSS